MNLLLQTLFALSAAMYRCVNREQHLGQRTVNTLVQHNLETAAPRDVGEMNLIRDRIL